MSEGVASLAVVGVSHHTAPLERRERLAYHLAETPRALDELLAAAGVGEGVLLSTCNRTELYLVEVPARQDATREVIAAWSARLGDDAAAMAYVHRGPEAAAHLFRVASGLDSMVLGEAQIQGQVRDAWEASRHRAGAVLHRLFQSAMLVAGRVRSETHLGRGAASVSSAAVQLAKQIFGSLTGARAMVLGAGEMAELALECLADEGVHAAIVANRTFERATELAARHGARAIHYDEAWATLAEVDLLLCSTAAPVPVVTADRVRPAAARRNDRPLCVLDIALPRDVEPAVGEIENVFLYDLDDLQDVVRASLERRRGELPAAERLVTEETARYTAWLAGLSAVPVLTQFRARAEELRARELENALRRLGDLTPAQRADLEQFSRALMNKFLHEPSVRLRAAAAEAEGLDAAAALRYLFALDDTLAAPDGERDRRDADAPEASLAAVRTTPSGER